MLKKLLLLLTAGLTGCGQFGPLYLPDQPPPIYVPKEQRQQNTDETAE